MSGFHLYIPRNETVQPPYFQNRIIMFCLPIPTLIYLWEIYIFPGSVSLLGCSQICGSILGIYKSLKTHVCGNWDWGRAIPKKGIHKWGFGCSAGLQGQVCTVHSQQVRTGVKGGCNEPAWPFQFRWKKDFKYDSVPTDKLVQAFIKGPTRFTESYKSQLILRPDGGGRPVYCIIHVLYCTLQRKNDENLKQIFLRKGISGPQPQFPHSCVCERIIYSPRWACLFCWRKYVDRSWEYLNRSQTHECGNRSWGRAIPRKGIYKRNCRCSVYCTTA
jgi:hypothetical protein